MGSNDQSSPVFISGLRKTFGTTAALDGLDLEVSRGEVHGFLGPNGSGKSTAIRVLLGLLRADSGTALLLGGDPWRDAVSIHSRIAYVPDDVSLWPELTGGEVIDLLGRLRGGISRVRRNDLIERFELDPTKKGRAYSRGTRQKVALVAAFASEAELLLLDEPTAGLDPLKEQVFRDLVRAESENGRTVLLSSHILSEVEALCDRVTIIREGKTVETGSLHDLRHFTRTLVKAEVESLPLGLDKLSGVHDLVVEPVGAGGARIQCQVDALSLGETLKLITSGGVLSLTSQPPTLEDLFLRHYATLPNDLVESQETL